MTHLRINLKTISVNLGPGCKLHSCIPFWPQEQTCPTVITVGG